jgi:hypothetical protein
MLIVFAVTPMTGPAGALADLVGLDDVGWDAGRCEAWPDAGEPAAAVAVGEYTSPGNPGVAVSVAAGAVGTLSPSPAASPVVSPAGVVVDS